MSLGAAGCGYPESRCEYLAPTLFGFRCKKYEADLEMWRDEPKRLRKCSDDAHAEWEKHRDEQRKRERGGER